MLIGNVNQHVEESFVFNDSSSLWQLRLCRTVRERCRRSTPNSALAGRRRALRLQLQRPVTKYEQWWYVGHIGGSRAQLFDQGERFCAENSAS